MVDSIVLGGLGFRGFCSNIPPSFTSPFEPPESKNGKKNRTADCKGIQGPALGASHLKP